jgi:hypothetical protein
MQTAFYLGGFGASISGTGIVRCLFFIVHWFCPHSVLVCCFMDMRTKMDNFHIQHYLFVVYNQEGFVYCAVRNGYLNIVEVYL